VSLHRAGALSCLLQELQRFVITIGVALRGMGQLTEHLEGMLRMVRNRQDAFAVCGAIAAILRSVGAACKLAASYR